MSTIITEYSDYTIQSIEYFIEKIQEKLITRDLNGLTKGKIDIINVTKQHPLVQLVSAQTNQNGGRGADLMHSGIFPAISVTPGNMTDEAFTLGQGKKGEIINKEFIDRLKELSKKTNKQIQQDVLITQNQIALIISEYNKVSKTSSQNVLAETHEWSRSEEINVSLWSESADIDILLGTLMDSILSGIKVGFSGDNSTMRKLDFKITKGLTNFQFGRTLFGTEYNLTFLNTYNNYIIYTNNIIDSGELDGTFVIPGES